MTLEELRIHYRSRILDLAATRGAGNVRVFGSLARGDAGPGSDVDLLVDFEPGRSLFDLTSLSMELEKTLGCGVDVVSSRGLRQRLKDEVMRDAVTL